MSSASHPDTLELRDPSTRLAIPPAGLPDIPGGWSEREWTIEGQVLRLVMPASPDAFLDDADVHLAFDRDDYTTNRCSRWPHRESGGIS